MMVDWWWVPLSLAGLVGLVLGWRWLWAFGAAVQVERARELFRLQRERLEQQFFKAASSSGKPRGLRWKECQWDGTVEIVRQRQTGQIAALAGVEISFDAIPGSDMEGLPAVGNLRVAAAVFFFQRGRWHTVGKAIFNMSPAEAIEHFKGQYERIA